METLWSAEEWEPVEGGRLPTLRAPATSEAERVAGMEVEVVRSAKRRKSVSARIVDGRIVIRMPQWMTKAQERVHRVAGRQAGAAAHCQGRRPPGRARELAHRYDLPEPKAIRFVGNQSSRSGSCTPSHGDIRISDRIAGFPGWVLDAVIVHELAHLVELSHGPEFQALADRYPKQERAYGFLLAMQLTDDEVE